MASSEPGVDPRGGAGRPLPYPEEPEHQPSRFERRARWVAALAPATFGIGFGLAVVSAVQAGGLSAVPWWQLVIALASLPTLPLFAAFPMPELLVVALAVATSLPVWSWGGAAQARRIEAVHGADWARWTRRYALFPLAALFMSFVFVGGLTPMGN